MTGGEVKRFQTTEGEMQAVMALNESGSLALATTRGINKTELR